MVLGFVCTLTCSGKQRVASVRISSRSSTHFSNTRSPRVESPYSRASISAKGTYWKPNIRAALWYATITPSILPIRAWKLTEVRRFAVRVEVTSPVFKERGANEVVVFFLETFYRTLQCSDRITRVLLLDWICVGSVQVSVRVKSTW